MRLLNLCLGNILEGEDLASGCLVILHGDALAHGATEDCQGERWVDSRQLRNSTALAAHKGGYKVAGGRDDGNPVEQDVGTVCHHHRVLSRTKGELRYEVGFHTNIIP